MKRKVNLDAFLAGAQNLKSREIIPRVDLMVGLPGDDLDGFVRSASYVADNDLADDPQVFPLSILPGTEFKRRAAELGLLYHQSPPYVVRETPAFTEDQLLLAFDYAEYRFDLSLHPWPDPDIAWRQDFGESKDVWVRIGENRYL